MAGAVHHPLFARVFSVLAAAGERGPLAERRQELLAGLSGRVVEVGAGSGTNFAHYPETVTEVVAIEPEDYLRRKAEEAAAAARVPVRVLDGLAESLPLEDGSMDAGVTCLVLCSVPDQAAALAELRRVIRPGGQLRVFEHVRAHGGRMERVQERVDRRLWPALFGGCHTARDTPGAIAAAGFDASGLERIEMPPRFLPVAPHVTGTALRP